MQGLAEGIKLSNKTIKSIASDAEKTAQVINLVYVHDKQPGISRVRTGKVFNYFVGKKKITNKRVLERINKLVIPPAWKDVWICSLDNGHLQATGIDAWKRKQYKYHTLWNRLRNHTKFYRLYEFGKTLPSIRKKLAEDLSLPGLPAEKIFAAVVCLMDQTGMRIGNDIYEKLYGSFGLTTLKNRHVSVTGNTLQFIFKGKKGVAQNVNINNKRLARIVKQCSEIPGKELFQYYADDGSHKDVNSSMVNSYLKSLTGQDFTAKDFRTWAGTIQAVTAFNDIDVDDNQSNIKKNVVEVLDKVAAHLGNTRAVCKKYYVHPLIIDLYERNDLEVYLKRIRSVKATSKENGLNQVEKLLMLILEKESTGAVRC